MSMSDVALEQSDAERRASGSAIETASFIESAIKEIDEIDGLPFWKVGEALDHIRALMVNARREVAKQAGVSQS